MAMTRNGPVRRAARLLQLGAGMAGGYLGYRLKRPFLDKERASGERQKLRRNNARQVREELQGLRGPVMKLGQALSMQTHFLGAEMVQELSALQMHAPPMHTTLMRAQFKVSMGKYPEDVFDSFEPEPFAAASLGQAHWATTKSGEKVAVKIQYPAMREAIRSDFTTLRAAGFATRLTGHLEEAMIREVQRGILEETDYVKEARNIDYFRKALAPLGVVRVPTVRHELSSDRVLTMSRIRGMRLQEFLQTNPCQELRDRLGGRSDAVVFLSTLPRRSASRGPASGELPVKRRWDHWSR